MPNATEITGSSEPGSDIDQIRKLLLGQSPNRLEERITSIERHLHELDESLRADDAEIRAGVQQGLERMGKLTQDVEGLRTIDAEHARMLRTLAESLQRALAVQLKGFERDLASLKRDLLSQGETFREAQRALRAFVEGELRAQAALVESSRVSVDQLPDLLLDLAARVRASARPHPAQVELSTGILSATTSLPPGGAARHTEVDLSEAERLGGSRLDLNGINSEDIQIAVDAPARAETRTQENSDVPSREPAER